MREALDITLAKAERLTGLPFLTDTGAMGIATAWDWYRNGMGLALQRHAMANAVL